MPRGARCLRKWLVERSRWAQGIYNCQDLSRGVRRRGHVTSAFDPVPPLTSDESGHPPRRHQKEKQTFATRNPFFLFGRQLCSESASSRFETADAGRNFSRPPLSGSGFGQLLPIVVSAYQPFERPLRSEACQTRLVIASRTNDTWRRRRILCATYAASTRRSAAQRKPADGDK